MVLRLWDFSESRILRSPDGGWWWWAITELWKSVSHIVERALKWKHQKLRKFISDMWEKSWDILTPKTFIIWNTDWTFFDSIYDSHTSYSAIEWLEKDELIKALYYCQITNKKISYVLELLRDFPNNDKIKTLLLSFNRETLLAQVIRFYF